MGRLTEFFAYLNMTPKKLTESKDLFTHFTIHNSNTKYIRRKVLSEKRKTQKVK